MKEPYECPRCGYASGVKQNMYKHLYEKKKCCQGIVSPIDLTDDVKEQIILNRKYHPPTQPINYETQSTNPSTTNIYQNITNYNQMNNIISKIDAIDKFTKYMTHRGESMLDFEDHIAQTYQTTIERLDNDDYRDFIMSMKTFYEIVDTLTTCENIEKLNVLYDDHSHRIRFVEIGTWKSKMFELGVDEIISKIQCGYLDYYEEYLLRKLKTANMYMNQVIKERLNGYYRFLVCFDLDPRIKDMSYLDDSRMESVYDIYRQIKNDLRKTEETRTRRDITNIIRRNCKASILDLNKKIMELIQVDEPFKQHVLEQFSKFSLNQH